MLRLRLLGKLTTLAPSRLEYRLFHHMMCQHPESKSAKAYKNLLHQYNLPPLDEIINAPIAYLQWKKIVTAAVLGRREEQSKEALATKSSLHLLSSLDPKQASTLLPARLNSHSLRRAVPVMCQLLCGVYPTNTRLVRIGKRHSSTCPCETKDETTEHLLGECTMYAEERDRFLIHLPVTIQQQLSQTPADQKAKSITNLILLGTDDPQTSREEPLDVCNFALRFLVDMHAKRSSLINTN